MSKLKARKPALVPPSKPKLLVFSTYGVGKTFFGLHFPSVYYIAPEPGNERKQYMEILDRSGGVFLGPEDGAMDFDVVNEQLEALATEKHSYRTVVIDSITKLFNTAIANEAERLKNAGVKNEFGTDKKPAIAQMRRMINKVNRLDMSVIFIAHEKDEWGQDKDGQRAVIGKIPDCWDKLPYELDLMLQLQLRGKTRYAVTKKTRIESFPLGESFEVSYENFAARYGKEIIEKEAQPIQLATPEQVEQLKSLVDLLKVESATIEKWLEAANAETFAQFNTEQADKTIKHLKSKLP